MRGRASVLRGARARPGTWASGPTYRLQIPGPLLVREEYRLAILVGFLGGFTTFSTYGYDTFALLSSGEWWSAAGNVFLSNALALLALWIGVRLAEQFQGA